MACSVFCVGNVTIKDAGLRATWQKVILYCGKILLFIELEVIFCYTKLKENLYL